jgi:hypothetical protein
VSAIPPALATAPRPPSYISAETDRLTVEPPTAAAELEKYPGVRVRRRAQLAPLALFVLVALAVIIYLALRYGWPRLVATCAVDDVRGVAFPDAAAAGRQREAK